MEQNNQQSNQPNQPLSLKNKNVLLSGIIIIVVLGVLIGAPIASKKATAPESNESDEVVLPEGCEPGFKFSVKTGEPCPQPETTAPSTSTQQSGTLSRADAKVKYANKILEITGACSIAPHALTQPRGTTILLDNNTASSHIVTVGKKTYRISPYHYTLSWLNVDPGTLSVTCDGTNEGTTVIVQ